VQKEVINIRKEIERQKWEEEKAQAARFEEIKDVGVIFMIVMGTLAAMLIVGTMFLERIN
jgi:hypothetical protein